MSSGTLSKARKTLLQIGYYAETGKKTGDGAVILRVRNPRQEIVADHVRMATETTKERARLSERKDAAVTTQAFQSPGHPPEPGVASMIEDPNPSCRFDDRRDGGFDEWKTIT